MIKAYPKNPEDIEVLVVTHTEDSDLAVGHVENTRSSLLELLDGWLLRMGYSSAYIKGVVSQLLTSGKIQVVFRNHTDRFELARYEDVISAPQAMKLLEDYLLRQNIGTSGPSAHRGDSTQRIVFQVPPPNMRHTS
jgi:hypothetical protein